MSPTPQPSDASLVAMAADAAARIDWRALCREPLSSTWCPLRKKRLTHQIAQSTNTTANTNTTTATTIFTRRHESDKRGVAVLAKSMLACSVAELRCVCDDARSSEQLREKLTTICGHEFVAARIEYRVAAESSSERHPRQTESHAPEAAALDRMASLCISALSVNAVTFERQRLFSQRREEGRFVDATTDLSTSDRVAFAKTMLLLQPAKSGKDDEDSSGERRQSELLSRGDVLVGFLFEETEQPGQQQRGQPRTTRIWYYAEYTPAGGSEGSRHKRTWLQQRSVDAMVKARLVRVAEWVERLAVIVRRRRLGVQVLIDSERVPPVNATCSGCKRSFSVIRKQLCRLCGCSVCEACSAMEVRETQRRRRVSSGVGSSGDSSEHLGSVMERVRVCTKCMARVDQCCYANVSLEDLELVKVEPDSPPAGGNSNNSRTSETIGVALTSLLQQTLMSAPATRRASVVSVIKCLVDDDKSQSSECASISLFENDSEDEAEQQLLARVSSRFQDPPLPLDQCVLATTERRNYSLIHAEDAAHGLQFPVPANEERRIEILKDKQESILASAPELDIICSLACQELQCVGATVSIVEERTVRVVATNLEFMEHRVFPRNEGFCSRTILNDAPLLVPHPEADVRFSYMMSVKYLNASFYCGFPLFAEDFTVIGSLCCLGDKSQKLTQTQFTVLKKLADTASRILQRPAVYKTAPRREV